MLEDLGSRVARRQIQTVPPLPAGSFYSLCEHFVTILLTLCFLLCLLCAYDTDSFVLIYPVCTALYFALIFFDIQSYLCSRNHFLEWGNKNAPFKYQVK